MTTGDRYWKSVIALIGGNNFQLYISLRGKPALLYLIVDTIQYSLYIIRVYG